MVIMRNLYLYILIAFIGLAHLNAQNFRGYPDTDEINERTYSHLEENRSFKRNRSDCSSYLNKLPDKLRNVSRIFHLETHQRLGYRQACAALRGPIHESCLGGNDLIYSGTYMIDKRINCEHIVPQKFFDHKFPMKSGLHHLYSANMRLNSIRGYRKFSEIPDTLATIIHDTGSMDKLHGHEIDPTGSHCKILDEDEFEPNKLSKGNVARSCAYFFTRYPKFLANMARV